MLFNEVPAFRAQNVSPRGETSWGKNWLWCLGDALESCPWEAVLTHLVEFHVLVLTALHPGLLATGANVLSLLVSEGR